MAKAKNNKSPKVQERTEPGGIVLTALEQGKIPAPGDLETMGDIKREQARIYRLVFDGKLHVSELSRLIYALGLITQAIKTEVEISALQAGYIGAWSGIQFIGVPNLNNPQPQPKEVIEHEPVD